MSHRGQEPQPGYMDGVCVKISERYKPPPRINLAVTYSQRLSLNKQIQDNLVPYDFSLEVNVKDRVRELRNVRKLMHEEKKDRLEKIKEARKKYEKSQNFTSNEGETQMLSVNSETVNSQTIPLNCTQIEQVLNVPTANSGVLYSNYSHILTPTPSASINTSKSYACDPADKSPFNISDFEADTSSPFDNMELKTINDIEELAQVLKKDSPYSVTQVYSNYVPLPNVSAHSNVHPNYIRQGNLDSNATHYVPYSIPHASVTSVTSYSSPTTIYNNLNGYYYTPDVLQTTNSSFNPYNNLQSDNSSDDSPPQPEENKKTSFRSVPDIMKALEVELDNTHVYNKTNNENHRIQKEIINHPKKSEETNKEDCKSAELDESYKLLPKNLQHLSRNISSMGFPLSRVARACQVLGDDHKKIVEHLLAMSELLDLGFSEKDVSSALLQCNNDRDKALDILIS